MKADRTRQTDRIRQKETRQTERQRQREIDRQTGEDSERIFLKEEQE